MTTSTFALTQLGHRAAKVFAFTPSAELNLSKLRAYIERKTERSPNSTELSIAWHAFNRARDKTLRKAARHRMMV